MSDQRAQLKRQILNLLRNNGKKAFRAKEIAKRLNIRDNNRFKLFQEVLGDLAEGGMMEQVKGGRYRHRRRDELHQAQGTLRLHPQGHGFVSVPGAGDYYIPPNRLNVALDGDWVRIALAAEIRDRPTARHQEAEVLEVVDRRRTETVGDFEKMGAYAFVKADDQRVHKDIYVPSEAFAGARAGDKVRVSIDTYNDPKSSPEGRVLEVLGRADDPEVAVLAIALSQGISGKFPPAVEEEAAAISGKLSGEDISGRLDLRKERVFTVDPEDAKDFDDAIHIKRLESGDFEVGVHVADVAHYVKQGSLIDGEAYSRGTSAYLVDRVIPMLPEKLSNQVCSLRPDEDRLTYSIIMEVSPRGAVKTYEIRETAIRSQARFSYEEAQLIIDGGTQDHPFKDDVLLAAKLTRTLARKRRQAGSIDFNTSEIQVVLDDKGRPTDIIPRPRLEAHRLIEELMLMANRTASEHIAKNGSPAPFVYRVHDRPDAEKIKALREYVRAFGYDLPSPEDKSVDRKELAALMEHVRGTPEEVIVTEAALRAMAKAVYSPANIGHFGLGFKHYSHFTSPIRRYPDLIAHRLLKHYARGGGHVSEEALAEACEHCSAMERQAVEAERESIKLKQVEYVAEHVGNDFDGVVSGVTKFGVFVEITRFLTEGLVHVRDMNDDFYEYDERRYMLVGVKRGRKIRLGDKVRVKIAAANVESRKIDLLFAE